MRCSGEETSGPGGRPSSQPRRASRQLAPQGTRNKRSLRAPKEQRGTAALTVPKDSGPGRHPRTTWSWEQAACGPGKLSRLETAPIPKKNFPTPDFFLLGPRQSAPLTAAVPAANPFRWPPQRGTPWQAVSPRENLHALAKFGQFCFGRHRLPNETNRRLCQSPS